MSRGSAAIPLICGTAARPQIGGTASRPVHIGEYVIIPLFKLYVRFGADRALIRQKKEQNKLPKEILLT